MLLGACNSIFKIIMILMRESNESNYRIHLILLAVIRFTSGALELRY